MHIVSFELDPDSLDLRKCSLKSVSKSEIRLPYRGVLPEQMPGAEDSVVLLNLQPMQHTYVAMLAKQGDTMICGHLDAPIGQLCELLDEFFQQKDTGLTPYWRGWWQACYDGWRRSRREPMCYLPPFSELLSEVPECDIQYLIGRFLDFMEGRE